MGGGENWEVRVFLGGDREVLALDSGAGCTTLWIYENPLNCNLFKIFIY